MSHHVYFHAIILQLLLALPLWASAEQVNVGVVLPLTGATAPIGESVRNGIILADEENDHEDRVRFIFEDDQFLPSKSVTSLRSLMERIRLSGAITFGSGPSMALAPILEQHAIPSILLTVEPAAAAGTRNMMRLYASTETLSRAAVDEARKRGYSRVAIAVTENDAMLRLAEAFDSMKGPLETIDLRILPSAADVRAEAAKIMRSGADAVYLLLFSPQGATLARQLRSLGYKGGFFGAHSLENMAEIDAAKGALDEAWFVSSAVYRDATFPVRYCKRFSVSPENGAPHGYDAAKIMISAVRSSKLTGEHLASLEDFQGVLGNYGAKADRSFQLGATVRTVAEYRVMALCR